MTGVLIRRLPCEDTETQGECHVKIEDWSDTSTSQRMPKIAGKPPEIRKDSPTVFRGCVVLLTPQF